MEDKNEIKTGSRMILILAITLLIAVTASVSYAYFYYTNNDIGIKPIIVYYDKKDIEISDIVPKTDDEGIKNGDSFNLRIINDGSNTAIPYEVTIRKDELSTVSDNYIKLYLEDFNKNNIVRFSDLIDTDIDTNEENEKTLYKGIIPANLKKYDKTLKIHMWVDDDFNIETMENQSFKISINLYSDVSVIEDKN